jgi:methionyl-tRNA synthetase
MEGIVTFKDWQKLDLRVAQIQKAERVENTDNLYKIDVDLGNEKRTIVSGLVPYYSEDELKDKKIILFCNLDPRTIRGIESKGMILAAVTEDENGKEKECRLLQPDADIELGSQVS